MVLLPASPLDLLLIRVPVTTVSCPASPAKMRTAASAAISSSVMLLLLLLDLTQDGGRCTVC